MGIKKLFDVLNANKHINLIRDHPGALEYIGDPEIENCRTYIDFSVILYRYVLAAPSIDEGYANIKNMLCQLKEKNNIIKIFLDPPSLKKKEFVHKFRTQQKKREIKKLKTIINDSIQENILLNSEIQVNPEVSELLELATNKTSLQIDHLDDYKEHLDLLKNNHLVTAPIDNLSDENDLDVYSFLDEKPNNVNLSLTDSNFKLFAYLSPFSYHQQYILQKLFADEIIDKEEVIQAEKVDAEFALLKEYLKDDNDKIKVIISSDQDLVFFSLFNASENFISISTSIKSGDVKIVEKTHNSKILAFLTIFFNASDYFNGVFNCALTKEKVCALRKTSFFDQIIGVDDMREVIKIFLQVTKAKTKSKTKTSEEIPDDYKDNIDRYFEQLELYKTLDPLFYEQPHINRITIGQMYKYFDL